ncbi:hypothetical protein N7492_002487 [Penicillium capsulatum]|uniref:BTB domain-containing protein n=1 Tax=Penicillium capsulatum TaxID=69766 RepID=A0A9W9IK71_9EURO|nr:hypothetical protein N7492_002487 [Penicillium capsulatum]KAJ6122909.1 hypothetical protein N7512_005374 [Penicillium capsulatum]
MPREIENITSLPPPYDFSSLFKEKPWEVLVGHRGCVIYAHPSVLARASPVLKNRIKGAWSTTTGDVINWERFDEQTIECVMTFFYAGRYDFISSTDLTRNVDLFTAEDWDSSAANQVTYMPTGPDRSTNPGGDHQSSPHSRPASVNVDEDVNANPPATSQAAAPAEAGLGDIILLHVKVYSFAHEYLSRDLLKYSLASLRAQFQKVDKVSAKILPSFIEAIKHLYSNTPPPSVRENPARQEITDFVVANHKTLIVGEIADTFSDAGSAFIGDLNRALSREIDRMYNEIMTTREEMAKLEANPRKGTRKRPRKN